MAKRTYFFIIFIILASVFLVLGSYLVETNTTHQSPEVILIVKSRQEGFEFWSQVTRGAVAAAKEHNVQLTVDGAMSEEDTAGQIAIVEKSILKNPDVIILAAVDQAELLEPAKRIKEAGIGLVLVDSGLSEQIEDCFVGTDNYAAAQYIGTIMGDTMQGGKLAIISHQMSTTTAEARIAGFESAILDYPGIEIIDSFDIGDSVEKSKTTTLELLAAHPDIKGFYATNQISAEGVTEALQEVGRSDITFYAFDSSSIQNEALEEGIMDGFAIQMPFNMGYMGVSAAVDLSSKRLGSSNIDTGFTFATQENMGEEKIRRFIYPFVD